MLDGILPECVSELVAAGRNFDAMEDLAARIKQGKSAPSLAEMCETLGKFSAAKVLCPRALVVRAQLAPAVEKGNARVQGFSHCIQPENSKTG